MPVQNKKPYNAPKLTVYGNIKALTQTVNSATANVDSNPSGTKKTS